jgi:hypothetical protein
MSKARTDFYRQCLLRKGDLSQMTWLPEQFAEVGRYVKLRNRDPRITDPEQEWSDGWRVETSSTPVAAAYVEAHERDFMSQRLARDR